MSCTYGRTDNKVDFDFFLIVQQWQKMIEEKLSPLSTLKEILSEEEAAKMGRKDPEEEVEKFVLANTQELGKDKWLCPLSGKKFKVCLRRNENLITHDETLKGLKCFDLS